MSNPARPPKEFTARQLSLSVAPDAYLPEGFQKLAKSYQAIEAAQRLLAKLDMEVAPAIVIPKEMTMDKGLQAKAGIPLATAKKGVPVARIRTDTAKTLVNRVFGKLPDSGLFSREAVGAAMKGKVLVDAGTEGALGRLALAYPQAGGRRPARPVTRAEAAQAKVRCGLDFAAMPEAAMRRFPLLSTDLEAGVTVNPSSDNGFPVLAKWNTPGAAELCMRLAVSVRAELEKSPDVGAWLRAKEIEQPWLVAVRGKAKADYYAQEKVTEARMRFYNAFPRQMMLIMQQATQVLEKNALHIGVAPVHSGIGLTMVRKGADTLVKALQAQLDRSERAYVHVGDDSWVVVRRDGKIYMFALDASNFDLTQHGDVTMAVHEELRGELRRVDKVSAELWFQYARERLVVVTGTQVRRMKHAGPSGMPLQSKVNDMLMDVMVTRALDDLEYGVLTEDRIAAAVEKAGSDMGFVVRLEQFWEGEAESLVDALEQVPFLFIGYYFHVRNGTVRCCADIPRTMAQLPYPALKWVELKKTLMVTEAVRLGSICLNLGMPTAALEPAFAEFRAAAIELLEKTLEVHGDQAGEDMKWALQDNPFVNSEDEPAFDVPSLQGLLKAVRKDPALLWLTRPVELLPESQEMVASSVLVPVTWADQVEEEEETEAQAAGGTAVRPTEIKVRGIRLPSGVRPTHPPTMMNDGRPPPTAVWLPDRPKARQVDPTLSAGKKARRKDGILRREYHDALFGAFAVVSDDEYGSDGQGEDYY